MPNLQFHKLKLQKTYIKVQRRRDVASLNTLKRRFVEKTVCSVNLPQVPCQLYFMLISTKTQQMQKCICEKFSQCAYFSQLCLKIQNIDQFLIPAYLTVVNNIINRKFRYTYSNAVSVLIIINVLAFFVTYSLMPRLMYYFALIPSSVLYGHAYWQFVTYMFMHGGIWHLISNMLGLFIFGTACERAVGTREFVLFYLLTGVLSGIASFLVYLFSGTNAILLGASGALYAVMLLFSVIFPRARILLFGFIPVSAPVLVILYFAIELFSGIGAYGGGIAHMTHLFGLLFGFLYCVIRMRINPFKAWAQIL